MDDASCSQLNYRTEDAVYLIFERIIPYLVQGLLFGGVAPYLLHVSDESSHANIQESHILSYKRATIACQEWNHTTFEFPSHVTDTIIFYQCRDGHRNFINKINSTLAENPSQLARPNVIVIFERSTNLSFLDVNVATHYINYVISFRNLQFHWNGDISFIAKYYKTGLEVQEKDIIIENHMDVSGFDEKNSLLDFRGKLLQITTSQWSPFVMATRGFNGSKVYEGYAISVLQLLAENFNFTYDYEEENVYGSKAPNGTWIGMVGLVHRQQKDLAVAALTINANRLTAVDFTTPFWYEPTAAIINIPESYALYLFLPYTTTVWLIIIATFVLSTVFYSGLNLLASKTKHNGKKDCYATKRTAWYIVQLWLSQSGMGAPVKLQLRGVSAAISVSIIVMCATYSGNLIAAFTVYNPKIPLKSIDELSRSTEYFPFIQLGTVHHSLYQESKTGLYARLWERIQSNIDKSLCDGGYSYCTDVWAKSKNLVKIGDKSGLISVDKVASDCTAQLIPEDFFPSGYGIAMPKGSPYKPLFDEYINMMSESGILLYFEQRYKATDECLSRMKDRAHSRTLSIYEVAAMFVILMAGVGTSSLVLTIEILFKRFRPIWQTDDVKL